MVFYVGALEGGSLPERVYRGMEQLVARRAHKTKTVPPKLFLDRQLNMLFRGVEQLVARRAHNPKAVGSSPTSATMTNNHKGLEFSLWLFFFYGDRIAYAIRSFFLRLKHLA